MGELVQIAGIKFTPATARVLTAHVDPSAAVRDDLAKLRSGEHTSLSLLAHCLNGAEEPDVAAWLDYVGTLITETDSIDPDSQCREHGCARHRCDTDHA